jgi:hypothetical protein
MRRWLRSNQYFFMYLIFFKELVGGVVIFKWSLPVHICDLTLIRFSHLFCCILLCQKGGQPLPVRQDSWSHDCQRQGKTVGAA